MIEINNFTKFAVDKRFFLGVAKKVLKGENRERENLSIVLITPKEMQELNRKYRKKNKSTDVLSFEKNPGFIEDVNEIVICPAVIKKNGLRYKIAFKKELEKILIHGVLHILGYDHEISKAEEKKMDKKQKYYLSK